MRYFAQALICLVCFAILALFMLTPAYCKEKPTTRNIQIALKNAEFYNGEIDDKNSPKLKQAIRDFQTTYGLKPDGVVGNKTWTLLEPFVQDASNNELAPQNTQDTIAAALYQPSPPRRRSSDTRREHYTSRNDNQSKYEIGGTCQWAFISFSDDVKGELNILRFSAIAGYFLYDWLELAGSITYLAISDESDTVEGWAFPISAVFMTPLAPNIDFAFAPFIGYITLDAKGFDLDGTMLGFLAGIRYQLQKGWRLNTGIQYLFASVNESGIEVDVSVWMPDIGLSYYF